MCRSPLEVACIAQEAGVCRPGFVVSGVDWPTERLRQELGLPLAREGFCDRLYDDDGNLTSRKVPGAVLHDADEIRDRVVRMVGDEEIISRTGKRLKVRLDTLCLHGDEPSAVIAARAVRQGLEAAGVKIVTLPEMPLG